MRGVQGASRYTGRRSGLAEPEVLEVDNASGAVISSALTPGLWAIKASVDMYFTRGASGLAGTDVKVDEATPDTDVPIFGGETIEIIHEHDNTYEYLAFRTTGATGLVWIWKISND